MKRVPRYGLTSQLAPCPQCRGSSFKRYLAKNGVCKICATVDVGEEPRDVELPRREALLREFNIWLEEHPSAWDRANAGLCMGFPASDMAVERS